MPNAVPSVTACIVARLTKLPPFILGFVPYKDKLAVELNVPAFAFTTRKVENQTH